MYTSMLSLGSSYVLSNIEHAAKIEIRECVKWSLTTGKKRNGKSFTVRPKKLVAVAYRRWSFISVEAPTVRLDWKNFGVLDWRLLMAWDVVAYDK